MIDILFYRTVFEGKKKMKNTIPNPTLVAFIKWGQTTIEFEK